MRDLQSPLFYWKENMSKYSAKDFPLKLIHVVQKSIEPSLLSSLFTFCCSYSVFHKLLFERKVEKPLQARALWNHSKLSLSPSWWILKISLISRQFLIVSHFISLAHVESVTTVIASTYLLDFRICSELPGVSVSRVLPSREKGKNEACFLPTSLLRNCHQTACMNSMVIQFQHEAS